MKHSFILLAGLTLALLSGCSSTVPVATVAKAKQPSVQAEPVVVLPSDTRPPGAMDVDWIAPKRPAKKKVAPRKTAKPFLSSNKRTRRRLFVLPTVREN